MKLLQLIHSNTSSSPTKHKKSLRIFSVLDDGQTLQASGPKVLTFEENKSRMHHTLLNYN
jgi:hypothetical protein